MTHSNAGAVALAVASAILISGCSTATSPVPRPGSGSSSQAHSIAFVRKAAAGTVLAYVSDYYTGAVRVYNANLRNPPPLLTIPVNTPQGLAVDKNGTLYVVNSHSSVSEYPRGATSPSLTITAGLITPQFPAIDPQGNLWVTNSDGPPVGNVVEYKPGATTPIRTLTNGIVDPQGIAFDLKGNLFVVDKNVNSYGGHVVMYAPGGTNPVTTFGWKTLKSPAGIATDPSGNILVADSYTANVTIYDHTTHKLIRRDHIYKYFTQPVQIAVSPSNSRLYMAGGYQVYAVYEFGDYGQGPLLNDSISYYLSGAVGVAIDPPLVQ